MPSRAVLELLIELRDQASSGLSTISGSLRTLGAVGLGVAAGGIAAVGAALVSGIGDARETVQLLAQTEAAIRSTGGAAGVTAQQVTDLATAMSAASGQSLFGDADIQDAENMLLTFTNIGKDVFPAATQATVDMAAKFHTLPAAFDQMIGKALNSADGFTALKRAGVGYTDSQEKQIKTLFASGHAADAQRIILAELNKEFGGSARAAAQADGGFAQFRDRMGELAESVGARALPALNQFGAFLNNTVAPAIEQGVGRALDFVTNTALPAFIRGWQTVGPIVVGVARVFLDIAAAARGWGAGIINQLASGMAQAAGAVVRVLQQLGAMIAGWLQPHSPPKILPDIDQWGKQTAEAWVGGFGQADLSGVTDLGNAVRGVLEGLASSGQFDQAGIIPSILGSESAMAQAIATMDQFGTVSQDAIQRVISAAGAAGPQVAGLVQSYFALRQATANVEQAQAELTRVTDEYASRLAPLNAQLRQLQSQEQGIRDTQRAQQLRETISGYSALEQAAERVSRAQTALNATMRKFDDQLSPLDDQMRQIDAQLDPLNAQLQELQDQAQQTHDLERIGELNAIIADAGTSASDRALAQNELQQIQLREQIRLKQKDVAAQKAAVEVQKAAIEKQRDAEVAAAQKRLDTAKREQEATQKRIQAEQRAYEQALARNELEQMTAKQQITAIEAERDASVANAQQKLDAAAAEKTAAEARARDEQARVTAFNQQNQLIGDQIALLKRMHDEAARGGGAHAGGGISVPSLPSAPALPDLSGVTQPVQAASTALADFNQRATDTRDTVVSAFAIIRDRILETFPTFLLLRGVAEAVFPTVRDLVLMVFGDIAAFLQTNGAEMLAQAQTTWQTLHDSVLGIVSPLADTINAILAQISIFWQAHGQEILAFVGETWGQINVIIRTALELLSGVIQGLLIVIREFIQAHGTDIQNILSNAWTIISNVIGGVLEIIGGLLTAALAVFRGDWQGAWTAIQDMSVSVTQRIWEIIKAALDLIANLFGTTLQGIANTWAGNWENLKALTSLAIEGLIALITELPRQVLGVGEAIVQAIWDGIERRWDAFMADLNAKLQSVRDILPFSEPKDTSSPLYGLGKSGEALVGMIQQGIDRAGGLQIGAPNIGAPAFAGAALTGGGSSSAPIVFESGAIAISVSNVPAQINNRQLADQITDLVVKKIDDRLRSRK